MSLPTSTRFDIAFIDQACTKETAADAAAANGIELVVGKLPEGQRYTLQSPQQVIVPHPSFRSPEVQQIVSLISGYSWIEGRHRPLAMLQAFADDSSNPNIYLLAAVVASAGSWLTFTEEWNRF